MRRELMRNLMYIMMLIMFNKLFKNRVLRTMPRSHIEFRMIRIKLVLRIVVMLELKWRNLMQRSIFCTEVRVLMVLCRRVRRNFWETFNVGRGRIRWSRFEWLHRSV